MDIDVTQAGAVAVVAPRGEIDMATVDDLRRTLAGLIDRGQSRVLMDLAGVGYMDSSGLGAMVAAMKQARAAGGDVRLCALQDDVRSIFELTRLARAIRIHATRQEALASWR